MRRGTARTLPARQAGRPSPARRSLIAAALGASVLPALEMTTLGVVPRSRAAGQVGPAIEELLGPEFPYEHLSAMPVTSLGVDGGTLRIMTASSPRYLTRPQVLAWVEARALAVADYFSTLPGSPVDLLLVFVDGAGVKGGTSWGHRGAASRILIGKDSTGEHLQNDWVLVHELVHHAFPSVSSRYHWMEEGLATYVEPVIRVRRGLMTPQTYWDELMLGLPRGLAADGDQGLDNTPTWGRTYWGGALFYFLADLDARHRTSNRLSLRDALVALQDAGGNITRSWSPRRVFETFDSALGNPIFASLYERMRASPHHISLSSLWQKLGVSSQAGSIAFDDAAPYSHIRRAMTANDSMPGRS